MILIATLSSFAIGLLWIKHEHQDFKRQSEILKANYIELHKQEIKDAVENVANYVNYKTLLTEKLLKQTIRQRVYEAYGIAENIYQHNLGKFSDEQIIASIKQALRPVRFFDNRNYYFIDDLEGNSILFPPNTSFEGNNLMHIKNKEGVRPFPDIIKLVKNQGEGYYIYNWVKYTEGKIPTDKEYPKITFFKLFEPYNWFIAVGEYLDYIEDDVKKEILERVSLIKVKSGEYVRVHSYDGLKLVSDGKVHIKPVNEQENPLTQEQKKAAQSQQGGFIFYDMADKGKNTMRPRVLFAQNLSGQEWVISAATYIDEVNEVIEEKRSILKADAKRNIIKVVSIILGFWFFALILARYISFKSKSSFKSFTHFFQKASTEAIHIDPNSLHFSEFSELAISGNQMIEDRQKAQQMLKKSELRFRQIAENIKEVFWIVSPDYEEVIYISPAYEVVWGKSCENLYKNPKSWLVSVVSEDVQKINDFLDKMSLIEMSEIVFPEFRILRPDGTKRWISARAFPVLNEDGEIYRLVGIAEDITERKRAEEVLEKRVIALTRPLDDPEGITFEEVFNIDDIQRLQDQFADATGVASVITNIDGTPITRPSNFCRLCHDIIRKTEKGLANCFKSDAELGKMNPKGPAIQPCLSGGLWDAGAGISVGGRHIANWLIGQVRDETQTDEKMKVYAKQIGADEESVIEAFHKVPAISHEKFGKVAQVLFTLANQLSDSAYRNVQQARFINERKRAEEEKEKLGTQLRQAQKMESVGRLAGGVAHDFNNMLGVILGHTELALLQADEKHDLYSDLKEIQTAATRSADITKQLLAFARKQTISPRQLDLNNTVESMLNLLRRLIGENIDLVWQPAAYICPVKMDPSQIDQILANLCINARDAISGVGKLTIETNRKTFDEEYCKEHSGFAPGDFVVLAVSDNGCGMDKEILDNLFEPFFTTKDVGKGTGLGLATVYGIVKQNNGFINVYSEPGQGSTFKIYLPRLVAEEDTDKAIPEKRAAAGGTESILLVEDEPTILRMTRMMLERKGYSVLSAATPIEAMEKAKEHSGSIDLLMSDVVMPVMNGRDLAEKIIALYPDIKLLFMSGYTEDIIAHQGVLDDGVAFIQKPFSLADMTEKVRNVLDNASGKNQG